MSKSRFKYCLSAMAAFAIAISISPYATAKPVTQTNVSTRDPATFQALLQQMGYVLRDAEQTGSFVSVAASTRTVNTIFVLGGCKNNTNCTYLVLIANYYDVVSPPSTWLEKINERYDIAKVALNDDRSLRVTHGAIVEGLPIDRFRYLLDEWQWNCTDIIRDAIEAKLDKAPNADAKGSQKSIDNNLISPVPNSAR